MKSFGSTVKEARLDKGFSISDLEEVTKIKPQFLRAIEGGLWEKLPSYPVLQGFVRSIGHALDVDENRLIAVLRRDYPPKQLRVVPKPDIGDKINWRPKIGVFLVGLLVLLLVASYLAFQYHRFISPPELSVEFPPENFIAESPSIEVRGSTSSDATIKINNQSVLVDKDGKFSKEIDLDRSNTIEVKATSRSGKETVVNRKIETNF